MAPVVNFIGSLIMAAVGIGIALKLWKSYKKSGVNTIWYFYMFFLSFGVFQLFLGLPQFFLNNSPDQIQAFYIFGHMSLMIGLIYQSRIPFAIIKPELEKYVIAAGILVMSGLSWMNLSQWGSHEFVSGGAVFLYTLPMGKLWVATLFVNFIVLGTGFFGWLAWNRSGTERVKNALIAVGFLLMFLGGPMHTISLTPLVQVIAEVTVTISTIIIATGIYYENLHRSEKDK